MSFLSPYLHIQSYIDYFKQNFRSNVPTSVFIDNFRKSNVFSRLGPRIIRNRRARATWIFVRATSHWGHNNLSSGGTRDCQISDIIAVVSKTAKYETTMYNWTSLICILLVGLVKGKPGKTLSTVSISSAKYNFYVRELVLKGFKIKTATWLKTV